ncbi:hypothetical protein ACT3SZ_04390 [Corynebacterium sp. AOP40-9SA-29]|uniref:hypothetical protein n=1 Tax=Corynebacterium sp. AOP40-9SA-29 TaxID=3457677 RepID=UPI004033CB97
MHTISLNDGESHAVDDGGLLKVQVFPVGGSPSDLRISVTGEDVRATTPNNTLAIVTAVPASATITIAPTTGGDFGIDQAVRLTVTGTDRTTVEFPVVRVGGVPEKKLGRIDHTGSSYNLTAYGSSVSTDLPRAVMAVSSAVRTHLTSTSGASGVSSLRVFADTGATLSAATEQDTLTAAVTAVRGLATTFSLDTVELFTGAGRRGEVSVPELDDLVLQAAAADVTRVGASVLPGTPAAGQGGTAPGTLTVHLTSTPVTGMVADTVAGGAERSTSLILVLGDGSVEEASLFSSSPDLTAATGVLPVDARLAAGLLAGDPGAFNHGAAIVASILDSVKEVSA